MARSRDKATTARPAHSLDPFRRAVLRGLGVLLPPLLTIVIFLWVGNTIAVYVLEPLEDGARWALVNYAADIRHISELPDDSLINGRPPADGRVPVDGDVFVATGDDLFIPDDVQQQVRLQLRNAPMPQGAHAIYTEYYNGKWYLQREYVVPVFVLVFVMVLYVLGKFLAAGLGRFFWHQFEAIISRVPLVRNVYTSVKQVTDLLFSESAVEFNRVVAIQYPRKGIWTLAFVTSSESFRDLRAAANESVMAVFVPTSPMPFTGFALTVKKSEVVDVDITIDEAIQFIVSCGVVVAPRQLTEAIAAAEGSPDTSDDRLPLLAPPGSQE